MHRPNSHDFIIVTKIGGKTFKSDLNYRPLVVVVNDVAIAVGGQGFDSRNGKSGKAVSPTARLRYEFRV